MAENIYQQLGTAKAVIDNVASDATILDALTEQGYDANWFRQGCELHNRALALHKRYHDSISQKQGTVKAFRRAHQAIRPVYALHVKIARTALRGDPIAMRDLGLFGSRKEAIEAWLTQAAGFYRTALANPGYLVVLNQHRLSSTQLRGAQKLLQAAVTARQQQLSIQEQTRNLAAERQAAMTALKQWMATLKAVARAVLTDTSALEKLGIPVHAEEVAFGV